MDKLSILFAASEAVPFVKTGGLGDVAGSLPKELMKSGQDVRIVMPKYAAIPDKYTKNMQYVGYVYVNVGFRHQYCGIFQLIHEGVTVYFLDNEYYFKREGIYGYPDEAEQFAFFSRAILDFLPAVGFKPDVLHCNDWQTGIVSLLLKAQYKHFDLYKDIKTVFTIHNLKYQGVFPKSTLTDLIDVGWEYFTVNGIEFFDQVNYMKAGIEYSDYITTVSRTYANEIKSDYFGENLNNSLNKRANDLFGILNGIDYATNDPETDKRLFATFNSEDLEGKSINKKKLQEYLGLPQKPDVPVIGIISRLVDQKGFDLIAAVLNELLQLDLQLIILGTGEYRYEELFKTAAKAFPEKVSPNIKVRRDSCTKNLCRVRHVFDALSV